MCVYFVYLFYSLIICIKIIFNLNKILNIKEKYRLLKTNVIGVVVYICE